MSGICGIVTAAGPPVDRVLLAALAKFMRFRGPDAQNTWASDTAGLGHALLHTDAGPAPRQQPLSIDGQVWITADARIDGQAALKAQLARAGQQCPVSATDAELILHAYMAWGEACVRHLLGDFAFAIWDGRTQQLFCARDHFGVKQFFYSQAGSQLVFSNTLDCLRSHPLVSDALNDLFIADFLLFESSQDPEATAFAAIRRLPAAHTLAWSASGLRIRRYWSLPAEGEIRFRKRNDYVVHFRELLDQAVGDRLRSGTVAIEMSGGLDSTAVAAVTKQLLLKRGHAFTLKGQAIVYDRLIPDQERRYAAEAAAYIGMPLDCMAADDFELYGFRKRIGLRLSEPFHLPEPELEDAHTGRISAFSRVAFTGCDGDSILNESPKPYLRSLWKQGQYFLAARGAAAYAMSQGRILPLGARDWLKTTGRRTGEPVEGDGFPPWINPELEERLHLRERWGNARDAKAAHPTRPYAFSCLEAISRLAFFDGYDAGQTRFPLEYRHPLMDLRLVEYCLAIPPAPWCVKKHVLRQAMAGLLPDSVRLRPKESLAGAPHAQQLLDESTSWVDGFKPDTNLYRYVDDAMIPSVRSGRGPEFAWKHLLPLSLHFWLQSLMAGNLPRKIMESKTTDQQQKKTYHPPVVQVYGGIQALTNAVGPNGAMDGGVVMGAMMSSL